jgi:hypothetical protein
MPEGGALYIITSAFVSSAYAFSPHTSRDTIIATPSFLALRACHAKNPCLHCLGVQDSEQVYRTSIIASSTNCFFLRRLVRASHVAKKRSKKLFYEIPARSQALLSHVPGNSYNPSFHSRKDSFNRQCLLSVYRLQAACREADVLIPRIPKMCQYKKIKTYGILQKTSSSPNLRNCIASEI